MRFYVLQELTPRSALREHNQNAGLLDSGSKRKTSTPSRLKLMFTGRRSAVGHDSSFADEVENLSFSLNSLRLD
jgi:hypothetical protein